MNISDRKNQSVIDVETSDMCKGLSSKEEIERAVEFFQLKYLYEQSLDVVHDAVLILNENRQIVYANKPLFKMLGNPLSCSVYGKKPGELFNCPFAIKCPEECGDFEQCLSCGMEVAILKSQKGIKEGGIYLPGRGRHNSLFQFRVKAIPELYRNRNYTILALSDQRDLREKEILERFFIHDITNTVGNIRGIVDAFIDEHSNCVNSELIEMLNDSVNTLLDEVNSHRQFLQAEKETLEISVGEVLIGDLLKSLFTLYGNRSSFGLSKLILDSKYINRVLFTSETLLKRVIGNLLKNALERSAINSGTVTLGCSEADKGFVEFWVHNDNYIPEDIKKKIFKRSFSTKGSGRGIGTYSVKLFTERYLKGKVFFTTDKEYGTRFSVLIPVCI